MAAVQVHGADAQGGLLSASASRNGGSLTYLARNAPCFLAAKLMGLLTIGRMG